ncbi:hypothetical protein RCF27_09245 [Rhodococcus pyridinivorans]|uniref:hypothetical protein n=1 Tax=Rhodococcus pyridinivorans TaxID=103816 RepID=UPI00280AC437|nr:hypothetical protein [Rhodococcus pyridinivorans]WMM74443.1 hypothetical protein RCF27_09245 [Rhodococcus pyridinivorans]
MAAAEQRHRNELNDANDRVARQIKYEWYREQARAVASIWDAVGRSMEPISRLAQVIEELIAVSGANPMTHPACHKARNAVSETYVVWRFQLLEVLTVITTAEMLIDEKSKLAEQIDSLKGRVQRHIQDGMAFKNAAMKNAGGAGAAGFMKDINEFLELREPMTREVRKLLASTTNTPRPETAGAVSTTSSK